MSITVNNTKYEIPGVFTADWDSEFHWVKYITDKSPRTKQIKNIVAHTHEGIKSTLIPGTGPNSKIDEALARYQVNTERQVSWDYTIDLNGEVIVQNDPLIHYSWQAGAFNPSSVGFELVQETKEGKRFLYEEQIAKTVLLIDFLTAALGIQRQIPWSKGKPVLSQIKRIIDSNNFIGIVGHVNLTKDRGPGDPGEHIFNALKDAGYECFDIDKQEDLICWKTRQRELGVNPDGIPLKDTVQALKAKGIKNGMWIQRPIDQQLNF